MCVLGHLLSLHKMSYGRGRVFDEAVVSDSD